MASKITRRAAIGAAAALCLTSVPLLLAPAAVASTPTVGPPPAGTVLTGAQAKAVYVRLADRLATTGLTHGLRLSGSEKTTVMGTRPIWTSTVVVDPKRRLVSETGRRKIFGAIATGSDVGIETSCEGEDFAPGGYRPTRTLVTRARVARWEKVRAGYPHRQELKLLGRPKAKWVRTPTKVSSTTALRTGFTFDALGPSFVRLHAITGGTSVATTTGTSYTLTYRSLGFDQTDGVIEATVGATGVPTALRRSDTNSNGSVTRSTTVFTIAYGARGLKVPKSSTVVSRKRMVVACHALRTKEEARRLAESVELEVNGYGARTAARVRSAADRLGPPKEWKLRLTTTSIAGGVMIVGRHQLLKHPVVWTVVIRNGKAVRHQVR